MSQFKFDQSERDKIGDIMYGITHTDVIDNIIDRIETIISARGESDGWVRVEDGLPEVGQSVWVFTDHGDSTDIYRVVWTAESGRHYKKNHITHTMKMTIPSPPKQDQQ